MQIEGNTSSPTGIEPMTFRGYYSQVSRIGHLYKTDTSLKRPPRVGPCLSFHTDTSLRWTLSAGPKGVRVREC